MNKPLPWYAVHVRSNFERIVYRSLYDKGYELFLPTYSVTRQWSDRKKQTETPLFPGYLFCRFDAERRLPILTAPGVVQIIGNGKTPEPVSDEEISAVEQVLQSSLPYRPWPSIQIGQAVVVEKGPLMGVQGNLLEMQGLHRLVISITLLQRSLAVEVEASWVRPVANAGVLNGSANPITRFV
jgi:transcription antitermination factor NusG